MSEEALLNNVLRRGRLARRGGRNKARLLELEKDAQAVWSEAT
jgi:hypothetical protein